MKKAIFTLLFTILGLSGCAVYPLEGQVTVGVPIYRTYPMYSGYYSYPYETPRWQYYHKHY